MDPIGIGSISNTIESAMNILVFGKDGQLGTAFHSLLDARVGPENSKHAILYVGRSDCDLSDASRIGKVLEQFKPQVIINAAAHTAVDKAEQEPELAFAINAMAPATMAEYAAKHHSTFLHYSTDYVFDGSKDGWYLEDDAVNPLGVYGKSKAAGEKAIVEAFSGLDLSEPGQGQYAIFRTSWVYGSGGNFIRTILRLAKEREELKIISDQHGVPTSAEWLAEMSFDFGFFVDDGGELRIRGFESGIYHAVVSGETTWHGLACAVVQAARDAGVVLKVGPNAIKPILAVEYPLPAPRPMNSRMSGQKLQNALQANALKDQANMPKCPYWEEQVRQYVAELARKALI